MSRPTASRFARGCRRARRGRAPNLTEDLIRLLSDIDTKIWLANYFDQRAQQALSMILKEGGGSVAEDGGVGLTAFAYL